ncbi:MAG: S8 family serine peptidase, partial [Prevotella sp.]|nr:S8 family serine peptidase [Prevotella sp.]
AVVKVALPDVERLRYTAGVTSLEYPYPVKLCMDKGRPYCGVDKVQSGAGLPNDTGINGKGVAVIIVDSGLDYNHPAFRDKDGNTRIKLLVLRDQWGNFHEVSDPQEIAKLTSDAAEETHATHVMSIAAGTEIGNGYGGVAQEADLVFVQAYYANYPEPSEGIFYRVNTDVAWTLEAAQKAHEIAKRLDCPSVINMSLANEIGAHDGSDLAAQFMKEISQDAIYCLSAGNYGCFKEHVHHTFAQDGETAKISLYNDQYSGVQFFSDNDKPFSLKFRAAGDGIVPVTLASIRDAGTLVIDSENADDPLVQKVKPYISTPNFRIEMRAGKYYNGKYFVELFATDCLIDYDFNNFQLEIAADKDTHIDGHIFMSTGSFSSNKKLGEMVPDDNGSINSLVPGTNAIVVGAMAARATIPLIDGKEVDY